MSISYRLQIKQYLMMLILLSFINIYEKYKEQIFIWSAAKAVHHNIRSGFLYHTFRMVQSGIALGKVYGQALNHSLC